jgi:tRNA-specific 2-thiouridylase
MMKTEVRRVAGEAGLPVGGKRESQDICFVTDDSYSAFLSRKGIREKEGHFVDREGNVLGSHRGILRYTVGQRKGLGIAAKEPLYVVAIDAERNEVILGTEDETLAKVAIVGRPSFVAGNPPAPEFQATVKVRYRHPGAKATVRVEDGKLSVRFDSPQRSVTPGQALVLYDGNEVLGGGWIECASA